MQEQQEQTPTLPEGAIPISQEEANELLELGLAQTQDVAIQESKA